MQPRPVEPVFLVIIDNRPAGEVRIIPARARDAWSALQRVGYAADRMLESIPVLPGDRRLLAAEVWHEPLPPGPPRR